jgi:hypothetical protein
VTGAIGGLTTEPIYVDLRLPAGASLELPLPPTHNAFAYVYEGDAFVGHDRKALPHRAAGVLSPGHDVRFEAGANGVRLLLLAGKPIGEPVVQYGPFVMNTREEIEQAIADYQRGTLTSPAAAAR